ncbi:MAG: helix-turn-helix domain-containing protein [Nitrospirae bacterium]|nr:helix-turn-helix domain-containing protein [Nitrospirota bacterium]
MDKLLTPEEFAVALGIQLSTVYAWTHAKTVPYMKVGRLIRFRETDVMKWLRDRSQGTDESQSVSAKPAPIKPKPAKSKYGHRNRFIDDLVERSKKEALP